MEEDGCRYCDEPQFTEQMEEKNWSHKEPSNYETENELKLKEELDNTLEELRTMKEQSKATKDELAILTADYNGMASNYEVFRETAVERFQQLI